MKRAVVVAIEKSHKDDAQCAMVSDLFAYLLTDGVVSADGFEAGFKRLEEALPDLTLDVPNAPLRMAAITAAAVAAGCIAAAAATAET